MERKAHEYATRKAAAYVAKFKARGIRASAVDAVYQRAYGQFMSRATPNNH